MVDAIAEGLFVQDPTACTWCDYTAACGPAPLIELRRRAHPRSRRRSTRWTRASPILYWRLSSMSGAGPQAAV